MCAVKTVLESEQDKDDYFSENLAGLNPPLKQGQGEVTEDLKCWLNHVRLSQNVIEEILKSSAGNIEMRNARCV